MTAGFAPRESAGSLGVSAAASDGSATGRSAAREPARAPVATPGTSAAANELAPSDEGRLRHASMVALAAAAMHTSAAATATQRIRDTFADGRMRTAASPARAAERARARARSRLVADTEGSSRS